MSCFAATCAILSPCSSVPVVTNTSRPRARQKRASMSATMSVYVWPMWGSAFA
jgi:hypothetical protein